MPEKYTNNDEANALFGAHVQRSPGEEKSSDEQGQKPKHNGRTSQKQNRGELPSNPHAGLDNSALRRSSRIGSRIQYSTDSNSSFASPDPPKRSRGRGNTDRKQLTKPQKAEALTAAPHNSTTHEEENKHVVRRLRRPKKVLQRNSDFVEFASDSDDDDEQAQQKGQKAKFMSKKTRQRKVSLDKREPKTKAHLASFEDLHSQQLLDEESVQQNITNNRRSKKSEVAKATSKSKKPQTELIDTHEQDALDGIWTEKELQKLHEYV